MKLLLIPGLLLAAVVDASRASEPSTPSDWIKTDRQWEELRAGKVVLLSSDSGDPGGRGHYSARAALIVNASCREVWAVVDDGDNASRFQESLVSSRIIEKSDSHALLKQVAKVGFHKVEYLVRQNYFPPQLIQFELDKGDLKEMGGFWRFLPLEEGKRTLIVYELSIEPRIPIPGFILRKSISKNLPDTLTAVRNEALRRAESL